MANIIPNSGEYLALFRLLKGQTFRIGLHGNTQAQIDGFGEAITEANLTKVTNLVPTIPGGGAPGAVIGADEITVDGDDFTIPGELSGNKGDPATHPQLSFVADTGGASGGAGGYYAVDVASGELFDVGVDPVVESSGTLRSMGEGADFRITVTQGAE